jgi:hypothetical protein
MSRQIKIVNWQGSVADSDLAVACKAIQSQLLAEFGKAWPDALQVVLVPADGAYVGEEAIWLIPDITGASFLGEHMLSSNVPAGLVLVKPSLTQPGGWQATLDHEVCEQIVDPFCSFASSGVWNGKQAFLALETSDPVEDDLYTGLGGVSLSNFILPSWFVPGSKGPWDYLSKLSGPLTLSVGGYVSWFSSGSWQQTFGRLHQKQSHPHSRQQRRELYRQQALSGFSQSVSLFSLQSQLSQISGELTQIFKQEKQTMQALIDLQAQVAKNTTVEQSAIVLIQGIAAQLQVLSQSAVNPADLAALSSQLSSSATDLAAAIAANTPAAPASGQPASPPSAKK